MPYTYEYPRPMVTVDAILFSRAAGELRVLLIQRDHPPFEGDWAFPGGFVEMDESLEDAVQRELEEETGLRGINLTQLHAFGAVGRDPRGRSVSVAYYAVVDSGAHVVRAGDDARAAAWFPAAAPPRLAFDHAEILRVALTHLHTAAACT